ncbi:SurA N-terminal domain-containing protein [Corticimicrobacter populi]|uniref:Periplasmic chaperone PpiD n=1 Tax=Corticimicrobacter populi TaxID=2175229 RepID=A0A2V1K5U7_9BURK|nr:SurA N-terminal domain-containing protein [Corticimicrobacter populi]PWF25603.1 peptidylprolyl isomerase [Corticimicrobacter populi]
MFDIIRNHQRWLQFILLILILPSFVFVGVQGYTTFISNDVELVKMGQQSITQAEFDQARRVELDRYMNRLGNQFDPALIDTPQMREALLNRMIDQRLVAMLAADAKLNVSDEALRREIASLPFVQGDDGRFSPERYRDALAQQGMTPQAFENGMRSTLALARVLDPVNASAEVPADVANRVEKAYREQRNVQLHRIAAADFVGSSEPTEAQIKAWYDANQDALRQPEQVAIEYLVLDEPAATQGVTVTDQDIADYYAQNKSQFTRPERRRASHILVTLPSGADEATKAKARAEADALLQEARANPEGFADMARNRSQDPGSAGQGGDLGWIARNTLFNSVEDAVYGLQPGEISGVIESPFGFHILRLTQYEPEQVKPLEEIRAEIEQDIRQQVAAQRFADMATTLTRLIYEQRDSLQPAADALQLQIRKADGIARTELLEGNTVPAADRPLLDNPRVRQALFSQEVLREGSNSGLIEISPDTMVVVRVDELKPEHVPALAEVQDRVRATLVQEQAVQAAQAQAQKLLTELKEGKDQAEVFGEAIDITRQGGRDASGNALPGTVLQAAMLAPATDVLPVYASVQDGDDQVLVRVNAVGEALMSDNDVALLKNELRDAWSQAQDQALLQALRKQYQVEVLPAASDAIEGQDDDTV